MDIDPERDLELALVLDASPAALWRCWTEPALLVRWFTPKPVITRHAEIAAVPGGRFFTVMVLPDGTEVSNDGCILEAVPGRRLCFTDTLQAGFRPVAAPGLGFTAILTLEPDGGGTAYIARALHAGRTTRDAHAAMGFVDGWRAAAAQLDAVARTL